MLAVSPAIRDIKLDGILDATKQIGWRVLDYGLHTQLDLNTIDLAGIIFGESVDELDHRFIGLLENDLPVISVGIFRPQNCRRGFVVKRDYSAIGALVSSYLIEKGFRHVGALMHDPSGHLEAIFQTLSAEGSAGPEGFGWHRAPCR